MFFDEDFDAHAHDIYEDLDLEAENIMCSGTISTKLKLLKLNQIKSAKLSARVVKLSVVSRKPLALRSKSKMMVP